MLRDDLEMAEVPYTDETGRVFDFHSLRHQFISGLAAAGVHPKVTQQWYRDTRFHRLLHVPCARRWWGRGLFRSKIRKDEGNSNRAAIGSPLGTPGVGWKRRQFHGCRTPVPNGQHGVQVGKPVKFIARSPPQHPLQLAGHPNHGGLDERHSRTTFPAAQMRPPLTISPPFRIDGHPIGFHVAVVDQSQCSGLTFPLA